MISVAIVAHPSRREYVNDLTERLDAPVSITWDCGRGQWASAAMALASYEPKASHILVLEDDAIPCRDLLAGLEQVITREPAAIISCYAGNVRPWQRLLKLRVDAATEQGACLFDMQGPLWGVGLVLPTAMIPDLLAWAQHRKQPYDERIAAYAKSQGIRCVYTFPPLVDHRQGPSIYSGRPQKRSAIVAVPESALDVNWTAPSVVAPECGYVAAKRGWQCWTCAHTFMVQDRVRRHRCKHRV